VLARRVCFEFPAEHKLSFSEDWLLNFARQQARRWFDVRELWTIKNDWQNAAMALVIFVQVS
jgi:hypothetical protein